MEYDFYVYLCALNRIFSAKPAIGAGLVESFPDISEIFGMTRQQLAAILGPADFYIDAILNPRTLEWAQREVDWAASAGIDLIPLNDSRYPFRLRECNDAPLMLYCRGGCNLNPERSLAVVGTRRATYYGRDWCRRIVERLSECQVKPLIVSGLALGIDGTAHISALDSRLQTVAVLPVGLDDVYPPRHRELAERIAGQGALVTDFSSSSHPVAHHFVRRNRIIAGMADAVLLCESYVPGGGLITARLAASYGREVFAVPGRLSDLSFAGCDRLIAENVAGIVTAEDTVARQMGWNDFAAPVAGPDLFDGCSGLKGLVTEALGERGALCMDELLRLCNATIRELSVSLVELETAGVISLENGKYVLRH